MINSYLVTPANKNKWAIRKYGRMRAFKLFESKAIAIKIAKKLAINGFVFVFDKNINVQYKLNGIIK